MHFSYNQGKLKTSKKKKKKTQLGNAGHKMDSTKESAPNSEATTRTQEITLFGSKSG